MVKKYILLLLGIFCFSILTGCGESEELGSFQESINNFYTEVTDIEQSINNIDVNEEDAVTSTLIYMEQMMVQFEMLAELEVPVEFANVEELADDAADYMSEAVKLYTEAYEAESVNDSYIRAAMENYDSAIKRINYIADLLQGKIPEGAVVIEGDGNEIEPYTEGE